MLVNVIGGILVNSQDLPDQIRTVPNELSADNQAATGMIGPHLSRRDNQSDFAGKLDNCGRWLGQKYAIDFFRGERCDGRSRASKGPGAVQHRFLRKRLCRLGDGEKGSDRKAMRIVILARPRSSNTETICRHPGLAASFGLHDIESR
jgi:hypothetical protein